MKEIGLLGIKIKEELGGIGMKMEEEVNVEFEMGRD